ncbi:PKD domain-containing protein, partial [Paraburkholderia sp. SIMBA_009]
MTGATPLDVTLTLNEAGGTSTRYTIDWKDGSPVEQVTAKVASHTYSKAGTFTPSVIATVAGSLTAPFKSQTTTVVSAPP